MNASEEIELGGGGTGAPKTAGNVKDDGEKIVKAHARLADLAGPSTSDAAFLDALLGADEDRLRPWESCKLPSLGYYYDWGQPTCLVRPMGQQADKILATQRLAQDGQSLDYLFHDCVQLPNGMDPLDLLAGDRVYLLYYLRGITHGNIYEFVATCPRQGCKSVGTYVYDLMDLARTIRWARPPEEIGSEPYRVELPYLSESSGRPVWVGVRMVRGRDTNNMAARRKVHSRIASPVVRVGQRRPDANRAPTVDETLTENLELVISSVMGQTDRSKISSFISMLHSSDTAAIREWLRENSPGIDTSVNLNCPECGQEFLMELPITESFFRPTANRRA